MNTYTITDLGIDEALVVSKQDGFDIAVIFYDEEVSPEDLLEFEEDKEAVYQGDACWLVMCVTASKNGIELGSASIGACSYTDLNDMLAADGYYPDLINEAVSEARANLIELCSEIINK